VLLLTPALGKLPSGELTIGFRADGRCIVVEARPEAVPVFPPPVPLLEKPIRLCDPVATRLLLEDVEREPRPPAAIP
jgi:hypothetical protein